MLRKLRRKRSLFYLTLLSLMNLVLPQHVSAAHISKVDTRVMPEPVAVATTIAPTLPIAPDRPVVIPPPTPPDHAVVTSSAPSKKKMHVVATAYSSSVDETDGDPFTTASGAKVSDGIIGANCLPFGTKVRLPEMYGDRVFVVQDRMNARYGCDRIDLWMPTKHDAIEWGVKSVRVEVI